MKTIAVSFFRNNIVKILKEIEQGASITITSRGKPVALICPPQDSTVQAQKELDTLAETAMIRDVVSPLDDWWSANQ